MSNRTAVTPVYKSTVKVGSVVMQVVIVKEFEDYWLAQVLQRDISQAGKTPREAYKALERPIQVELGRVTRWNREPFLDQGPAPRDYWRKHRDAADLQTAQEL